MATASSKAITFSLIMFMVRVSLFCCCLGVRAIGGERGEDCPDRSIIYKASRNIQSPIRLKIIHHRNRKRQSPGRWRGEAAGCGAIWGDERLETRPPFKGGRAVAASRSLHVRRWAGRRQGGRAKQGGSAGRSCRSGRQATGPCSDAAPGRWLHMEECRFGERGPATHRSIGEVVLRRSEFKCENTKVSCKTCNSLRLDLNQNGRQIAPTAVSFQRFGVAQLAATVRPLRACCIMATRSTSASATVRASATHLLSTEVRPLL